MGDCSPEKKSGCGAMFLLSFGGRSFWSRRSQAANEIPNNNSKRRRGGSDEASFLDTSTVSEPPPKLPDKPLVKAAPHHPKPYQNPQPRKPSDAGAIVPANPTTAVTAKVAPATQCGGGQGRKVPNEIMGISGELDIMINDHQRSKGSNNLVRASSSNVFLHGNLGNLRQPGGANQNSSNQPQPSSTSIANNVLEYLPKTARENNGRKPNGNNGGVMGNIVRRGSNEENQLQPKEPEGSLCRALSMRLDPEDLKTMGNEEYKSGRFAEALSYYDRAIALDPDKAAYRSNKGAALTGLGRLLEAVFECREAVKIDPSYRRAHHRLATLYLRLGEAEKALNHYKKSGPESSSEDYAKVQAVETHVNRCNEARRIKDWQSLLKESRGAISSGADSALQVLAMQAEALLKLQRHEDADATLTKGPTFDVDSCTKFFGPTSYSFILQIRAQVDMAAGRFDDAVAVAQRAARLDSSSREVSEVLRRARAVSSARNNGNELFKASKFLDACVAYGDGLEHDPLNSVLLCNRAACRSKLGQLEKALEDCTHALNLRPSYTKARLRRADCNAKLERWEAAMKDYEMLKREMPGDEEVGRALIEAQLQLKKRRGEDD